MNAANMQRDDIYLIDMWRILRREWRWFVAALAVVLLATFAFMHAVKPQWQADAWIQIGQVDAAPPGQDPKVEPLQRVLERLQRVPFQNEVLESIGMAPESREGGLYRKSLKLEPLPYAGPLIKMSVRGYSPQQAGKLAEATVAQLRVAHRDMQELALKLAHARLDEVQSGLQDAIAERDRLQQAAAQNKDNLAALLIAGKNDEIRSLQQARGDLITRLSVQYTYETSLMWPVYVPTGQVFPNPVLTWGMGMVFGLLLGLFAAIARNAVRHSGLVAAGAMIGAAV
jgi:hypothetical protein